MAALLASSRASSSLAASAIKPLRIRRVEGHGLGILQRGPCLAELGFEVGDLVSQGLGGAGLGAWLAQRHVLAALARPVAAGTLGGRATRRSGFRHGLVENGTRSAGVGDPRRRTGVTILALVHDGIVSRRVTDATLIRDAGGQGADSHPASTAVTCLWHPEHSDRKLPGACPASRPRM